MDNRDILAKAVSHPGRREFIQSLGAASLGLAASGALGNLAGAEKKPSAVLDPEAPVRIGIIGRTGHLNEVFSHWKEVPGARITAYAFEDGDWEFNSDGSRRTAGGKYDLDSQRKWAEGHDWCDSNTCLYETYQEMLDKEKLDVVAVMLPYVRNAYASSAAAQRGIHVLCEKPVAINYDDLSMLERQIEKSGVSLAALFPIRTSPTIQAIKAAVGEGLIGRPIMAKGQKSYRFGQERPWYYKHKEIFGSSILWVGIHAIDYIRWTMGLEVEKVAALHGNLAHQDYPGCQDSSVLLMGMQGGAQAAVTVDYLRPAEAPTHGDDRLRLIGSGGVLETMDLNTRVELITHQQGPRDLELPGKFSLFTNFIGALRGQNSPLIGPGEATRVTRIAIAATEAAERGTFVGV